MFDKLAQRLIRGLGFEVKRIRAKPRFPPDFGQEEIDIISAVKPFTFTSNERVFALIQAVKYIERAGIPGAIVECGVWRGGSMMAAAYTLKQLGECDRDFYLYDTYEGMTKPSEVDVHFKGQPAVIEFERTKTGDDSSGWCYASLEDVQRNLNSTGYAPERLKYIKGRVEDTIPSSAPDEISLLRLDTDWYESTRHELEHLFPRLVVGGVLIMDDYGVWQGFRKAIDEYFAANNICLLMNRIDFPGRIAVKM
jgi:O-methyltransferase